MERQPLQRRSGQPYVICWNGVIERGFVLDGSYQLLHEDLTKEDLKLLHGMPVQQVEGWLPTKIEQLPMWLKFIPQEQLNEVDWSGVWVAH